jgi:hypothetical protein
VRESLGASPAFTKVLANGLGLAEDPGGNTSFGMHRCELLAALLCQSATVGLKTTDEKLAFIDEAFRSAGYNLDTPYLNPGSSDHYAIPFPATLSSTVDGASLTHGASGPDLYSGLTGIGWFLAELAAVTGGEVERHTALAALRNALTMADNMLHPIPFDALYSGPIGFALISLRAGALLGDEQLVAQARALISRRSRPAEQKLPDFDMMAGFAGTIAGLVILGEQLADRTLRETATELGDATREERFRAAAESAFAYERYWFDERTQNWPDFRGVPASAKRQRRGPALRRPAPRGGMAVHLGRRERADCGGRHRHARLRAPALGQEVGHHSGCPASCVVYGRPAAETHPPNGRCCVRCEHAMIRVRRGANHSYNVTGVTFGETTRKCRTADHPDVDRMLREATSADGPGQAAGRPPDFRTSAARHNDPDH